MKKYHCFNRSVHGHCTLQYQSCTVLYNAELQKKIYIKNNGSQMENNNCTTVETIANTSLANNHLQEDKPSQKITLLYIYIQTSSLQPPT